MFIEAETPVLGGTVKKILEICQNCKSQKAKATVKETDLGVPKIVTLEATPSLAKKDQKEGQIALKEACHRQANRTGCHAVLLKRKMQQRQL